MISKMLKMDLYLYGGILCMVAPIHHGWLLGTSLIGFGMYHALGRLEKV